MILSGGKQTVKLNVVFFVPDPAHNLESFSGLCDNVHIELFTKTSCVLNNKANVAAVSILTDEMFDLKKHTDIEPEDYMLDVRHAKFSQANHRTIE